MVTVNCAICGAVREIDHYPGNPKVLADLDCDCEPPDDYSVGSLVSVGGRIVRIVSISPNDPQAFFARPVNATDPDRDFVSEYWDTDIDTIAQWYYRWEKRYWDSGYEV